MRIDATGVTSKNIKKTVDFYSVLGFKFPDFSDTEDHVEAVSQEGQVRLMIDSVKMAKEVWGQEPVPSNHSAFAIKYDSEKEVDAVVEKLKAAGFEISKEPWDAFWGQRYAVVIDPDGYKVDLFAQL